MKKSLFTAFAVGLGLTANVMAQVPSYVPSNGLVGWWPFNGNANDESGNGNNGTVNGATLTTDRFGNTGKAYSFDGVNDIVEILHNPSFNSYPFTLNTWVNFSSNQRGGIITHYYNCSQNGAAITANNGKFSTYFYSQNGSIVNRDGSNITINDGNWNMITSVFENDSCYQYVNGVLAEATQFLVLNSTPNAPLINTTLLFGLLSNTPNACIPPAPNLYYNGKIDDSGIWNRALTSCEVANLYYGQPNSGVGTINLSPQSAVVGSNVSISTTSTTSNLQWQTNTANLGWQNVPSNSTYNGGTTNTLIVNNVQLANHNQQFRAISTSGNCVDTSNIDNIQIADTCITNVTVYDTLLTSVTDTLIINTTLSLPAPNNENTILIYPNPASDHITIDNGNYTAMVGYSIKITNNAGQQIFQSAINQAQFYVDLSSWTGNGLYFVHLIDPQNNTVTVRKIVLQ